MRKNYIIGGITLEQKQQYEVIYDSLVDMGLKEKYGHPGIYCVYIDEILVYIGKSRDMLVRIANHLDQIEVNMKTNKYKVIREARNTGHNVRFDVMEYCEQNDQIISDAEARLIQKHMPPLNHQIPKIGMSGYFKNNEALYITLDQILAKNK